VHQAADDDRQAGVHVRLLGRHEAEVVHPRQPDVLDDEVQAGEVRRHLVDVGHVERVLVQRPDRRALVHVLVLDPELLALLQEPVRLGVGELPAARAVVPLGGVELDALDAVPGVVLHQLLQAGVALARVPAAVHDQLAGEPLQQRRVLVDRVEAVRVPVLEVGGLEDRDVDVALDEHVALEVLGRDLEVLLVVPVRLRRAELVVAVEAVDPALGELLAARLPVLPAGVPEVGVGVDDEVLLAVLLVHVTAPFCGLTGGSLAISGSRNEDRPAADLARVEVVQRLDGVVERVAARCAA
jgi:hypothetical protein